MAELMKGVCQGCGANHPPGAAECPSCGTHYTEIDEVPHVPKMVRRLSQIRGDARKRLTEWQQPS